MKFEVTLTETYHHPIEVVWAGLTSAKSLSVWLMETENFVAADGHRFELTCVDDSGHRDTYRCRILALEPPRRMVWSWVLSGNEEMGATEVEFRLEPTDSGTKLTLTHRGDRDRDMLERFKEGWPVKLRDLGDVLTDIVQRERQSKKIEE